VKYKGVSVGAGNSGEQRSQQRHSKTIFSGEVIDDSRFVGKM
jgi:hypothetical protein